MLKQRIGFIGAGQMATALAKGFASTGLVDAAEILASDLSKDAQRSFAEATGGTTLADNLTLVEQCDVVFLAVKPHLIAGVAAEIKDKLSADKLVISVAAGIRLDTLAELLGSKVRLVRVMPNTPCLVGQGACGYCLGASANDEDDTLVEKLLSAVGLAYRVEERLLDAVTGLSGSGPAFVFTAIEALSDGGVRMGLPRPIATALAAQTVRGAAEMVLKTGEHTGALKDKVTSPGGTTIAGIKALEDGGLRAALIGAVEAAAKRSIELSKP